MKFQQTYSGWKRAVQRNYGKIGVISFYGDKDIGGAQIVNEFGHPIAMIGEWDGAIGEVFEVALN